MTKTEIAETKIRKMLGEKIVGTISEAQKSEPRGHYQNLAAKIIKPNNTHEVSVILEILNDLKIGVIPYSGGTGLVGGQIGTSNELFLLSLERMKLVREISEDDGTITVEAGITLASVQEEARKINRKFPLSLASEGSCQIGGNLATNAGGINVIKYGSARDLCLGLEAVFANGNIYNGLKSLIKDNTGYDLRHLLIGSEGTLGIITAATLKTFPICSEKIISIMKVKSPETATRLLRYFQKYFADQIQAFELLSEKGIEFLERANFQFKEPFRQRGQWMVLAEISGPSIFDLTEKFHDILSNAVCEDLILDAVVAQNESQGKAMWYLRESMSEANRVIGAICSSDISVPISKIPEFISTAQARIEKFSTELQINCFGHLGDGNLHFNVFPPFGKDKNQFSSLRKSIVDSIHEVAMKLGGSFSAEHGVGRLKVADFEKYGCAGKLESIRLIKNALDPNFILNPGAIISDF